MSLRPRSLRARTGLLLIAGLCVVQAAGLTIHALDHLDIQERNDLREDQHRAFAIYRLIAELPPTARAQAARTLNVPSNFQVSLATRPDSSVAAHEIPLPHLPPPLSDPPAPRADRPLALPPSQLENLRPPGDLQSPRFADRFPQPPFLGLGPAGPGGPMGRPGFGGRLGRELPPIMHIAMLPDRLFPQRLLVGHLAGSRQYVFSLLSPDEADWIIVKFTAQRPNPFDSPTFLIAFCLMTFCGGALILWGTQRLIAPLGTLVRAAEALGRDVNAAPLSETGPTELSRAAQAFNTMAANVRRLLNDRTLMLTAIGHDLRTPITRLKLRSEFIEDDELREKFLADLDEMEAMVAATLAFGRDTASREPKVRLDLSALLQTIGDEAAESLPALADRVVVNTPEKPVRFPARSLSLKRALMNLAVNALKYGGNVTMTLLPPGKRADGETYVRLFIDDDGPGLPEEDLETMFEPFVRAETSRNRETGGTGLGLAIARSIVRGHGGEITLSNRPGGGLRASVTLPA